MSHHTDPQELDRVFAFIREYVAANHNSPTSRELIRAGLVSSSSMASFRIHQLIERGDLVSLGRARARGYRVRDAEWVYRGQTHEPGTSS